MSGLKRGMEFIVDEINSAKDDKQGIIKAVSSYEKVIAAKEKNDKKKEENRNQEQEEINFNPNEIETIIYRNDSDKVSLKGDFKDRLRVKEKEKITEDIKIPQVKQKDKGRDRVE